METFIVIWILLLFAAAFALRLSFGNRKQKSVLAKLRNIDPEMSLLEEGAYVGGALGISQANQIVYIKKFNTPLYGEGEICEVPFSQLHGTDMVPEKYFKKLIIYYTGGEISFCAIDETAKRVRNALIPIIEQNIQSHNSAIIQAAGKNAKIVEVTVIGPSQLTNIPCAVKAYISNNVLCLQEKATFDNPQFQDLSAYVSLSSIVALEQVGDVHYATDVSGGGSSLSGAIIGGVIAGGAGAIIGSRQEVTSSTRIIDDRATVLKFRSNGQIYPILFMYDDYYILRDLIE